MRDISEFKDDRGRWLTSGLFYELTSDKATAIYTLKESDHTVGDITYISLKRLYLEVADPIEYAFVSEHLGSWNQWKRLVVLRVQYNKTTIADHIQSWREELEIKLRSQSVRNILLRSVEEKGYQAAKYIADAGWKKSHTARKAVVKQVTDEVHEDFKRLGLHRIK